VPIETRRPEIPRGLAAIIRRMMAKAPEDRYQTPAELILALDRLLQPVPPPQPGKPQTADDLVALLRRHLLLDDGRLDEVELNVAPRFGDVTTLLAELRSRDWLTAYQCGELSAGNGQQLALGGSYVLLRPLGEGGIGRVFLARPRLQGRHVAIKIVKPELAGEPEFADRFRREMRLTSQLPPHPNLVLMLAAEESDGRLFMVMEYMEGQDLAALIEERNAAGRAVTADEARAWMTQAARGLEHIHSKNMVHRDVKPANLFLTAPDGQVKILDLGVARVVRDSSSTKLTRTRTIIGTYDYMAPEQARRPREVDIRADLYGLGCSFYHVLTGRVPFVADNEADAIVQHTLEKAVPLQKLRPDLPPALAALIDKLMEKKPEDRYQTPTEVLGAL
jgi:serine/threonine-protein kinase